MSTIAAHLLLAPASPLPLATLSWQDWTVIVAFLAISILLGLAYTRRAGKNEDEYFVGGRSLPWWLAGTSMVATTFAADTPLAITEMVRQHGIYRNWFWWAVGFGAVLSTVLLSRLWRRSGVRTDVELIALRYSGRAADVLRGFRAAYFGCVANLVVIGWVTGAMISIATQSVGWGTQAAGGEFVLGAGQKLLLIVVLMLLAGLYSVFSGLWGVVVTDFFQFIVAMVGVTALAIFAVNRIGGLDAMLAQLPAAAGQLRRSDPSAGPADWTLRMIPPLSSWSIGGIGGAGGLFLVYIGFYWWTDKAVDQGGYLAQRLLSCKNEKHALGASLWFAISCYALRPWPWIIAALATIVLYPQVTTHKAAYTMLAMDVMGPWWRGLLVAALLAAFISTINTQINWGASYLLNDLYQAYLAPNRSQKHYVWMGRLFASGLLVAGAAVSFYIGRIETAWKFFALLGAGGGVVLLARWLWWRANAVGELAALAATLACSILVAAASLLSKGPGPLSWADGLEQADYPTLAKIVLWIPAIARQDLAVRLLWVVPIVVAAWLIGVFASRPTERGRLVEFVRAVDPPGPGWRSVRRGANLPATPGVLRRAAVAWAGGVLLVFGVLFGIGKALLAGTVEAGVWLAAAAIGGIIFALAAPRGRA